MESRNKELWMLGRGNLSWEWPLPCVNEQEAEKTGQMWSGTMVQASVYQKVNLKISLSCISKSLLYGNTAHIIQAFDMSGETVPVPTV
jgi:hypothetical protein